MQSKSEQCETNDPCPLLARTIDDNRAEALVVPGTVNDTYILTVRGKKPTLNMRVALHPLTYIEQPEYWEIQVRGCIVGIEIPAIGDYNEFIPLDSIRGKEGIEVIWADGETERFKVPAKEGSPRPQ